MDSFDLAAGDANCHQLKEINDSQGINPAAVMLVTASCWMHISPVRTREVHKPIVLVFMVTAPLISPAYLIACIPLKIHG
jgi:hypothetical protein